MTTLTTPRLLLRPWREADRQPFAAMNADPEVRRYFPGVQSRVESDATVDRFVAHHKEYGFTFFAAELRETSSFIGFVGIVLKEALAGRNDVLEIGWRLSPEVWRQGLATEGARACLDHAFRELKVPTVYAITPITNAPSIGVMRKMGMTLRDVFDHPGVKQSSGLQRHVLYGIDAPPPTTA